MCCVFKCVSVVVRTAERELEHLRRTLSWIALPFSCNSNLTCLTLRSVCHRSQCVSRCWRGFFACKTVLLLGGARVKGLRDEFTQLSNSWFDTPTVWWWRHTALSGSCWWLFSHWLATRCENLSISSWEDPHKPFTPTCNNDRLRPKGLISVEIKSITSPPSKAAGPVRAQAAEGMGIGVGGGWGQWAERHSILFLTLTQRLLPMLRCTGAALRLSGKRWKQGRNATGQRRVWGCRGWGYTPHVTLSHISTQKKLAPLFLDSFN